MALLYTKTRQTLAGSFETDLFNSAGKDWDAAFWVGHGIFSTGRRPCFINFRGDIYVAGAFSRVLVRPKVDRRMLPAGITPVRQKIACVEGGGGGGSTGNVLAYVTLLHKEGDRILAESDRSNIVNVGAVTGGGFDWSNLPTSNEDFRTTHIRGYRSVDGGDYRKAWESPYGLTTFTENVLTQNLTVLGQAQGRNGLPPKGCHYMTDWGGRMFYARTAEHPYRLWWSAPGFPEYVNQGSDFVDTWDRSAITGIAKARNELLALSQRQAYKVRQFGQESLNDFVLVKLDSQVGCINHFGIVEIHNRLWFPSEDGIWIYDGGFRYLMRDFRPYWVADYKANKLAFQTAFGYDDRKDKTYVYATRRDPAVDLGEKTELTCGSIAYVGTYESFEPSMGGENPSPDWTLDAYGRENSSALYNLGGEVLIGSCDGIIRKADATDADDDGDTLEKELIIRHGHNVLQQPGDDPESAKTLVDFWCYVEAELNAWTLYLMGGDEHIWNMVRPDNLWRFWKVDVAASALTAARTVAAITKTIQFLPKTVHYIGKPQKVSGRGFTVEIRAKSPVGMKYRGFGGAWEPGPADREAELETNFALGLEWREQGDTDWLATPIDKTKQQRTGTITLELRQFFESFGVGLPVDLALDYAGANMPADDTDQITTGTEKIRTEPFTGLDTAEANGTLDISGVDSGGVVASNSPIQAAVVVNTWDFELQFQIDGGGWNPYAGTIFVTTGNVLELRVQVFGSRYPTALRDIWNGSVITDEDPIAAAGFYLTLTRTYPGSGFGTYSGTLLYYDGPISGGLLLGFLNYQVNWAS